MFANENAGRAILAIIGGTAPAPERHSVLPGYGPSGLSLTSPSEDFASPDESFRSRSTWSLKTEHIVLDCRFPGEHGGFRRFQSGGRSYDAIFHQAKPQHAMRSPVNCLAALELLIFELCRL